MKMSRNAARQAPKTTRQLWLLPIGAIVGACHAPEPLPPASAPPVVTVAQAQPTTVAALPTAMVAASPPPPPKVMDLRLTEVLSPKDILAQESAYHLKTFRLRGRFLMSSLDAGFPMVYFTDVSTETKPSEVDTISKPGHQCRGPYLPGKVGAKFPLNTIIIVEGEFHANVPNRSPGGPLVMTNCSVKKE
jgi:hypothetical protein